MNNLNSNKKIIAILIPTSLFFAIVCFYAINLPENKNQSVGMNNSQTSNNQITDLPPNDYLQKNPDNSLKNNNNNQAITDSSDRGLTLSINKSRCSGCGKCTHIDPEHFSLSGQIATVISNSNLNSADLQSAINMCRENAISLE